MSSSDSISPPCHHSPEENASLFSKLYFNWMTPLIVQGYKEPLQHQHLYELPTTETAEVLIRKYRESFEKCQRGSKNVALWRVLFDLVKIEFFIASSLMMLYCASQIALPVLLREIVQAVNSKSDRALWLAVLLFLSTLIGSLANQKHTYVQQKLAVRLKSTMVMLVYRKAVDSSELSYASSGGKLSNLVASDANRFIEVMPLISMLWAAPILILVGTALLISYLTVWPALVGLFAICILTPLQSSIIKKVSFFRSKHMSAADSRIRISNEILMGQRVVKLNSWSIPFLNRIVAVRRLEIGYIRRELYMFGLSIIILITTPTIALIFVFMTKSFLPSPNNYLEAGSTMAALTTMSMIRMPLNFLSNVIAQIFQLKTSVDRLESFLGPDGGISADISIFAKKITEKKAEVETTPSKDNSNLISKRLPPSFVNRTVLEFRNASFIHATVDSTQPSSSSDSKENESKKKEDAPVDGLEMMPFSLRDISISLQAGERLAVVGNVASGKSSLLLAILGEMKETSFSSNPLASPSVYKYPSRPLGYASQQPWIMNDTVRGNIVFGAENVPDLAKERHDYYVSLDSSNSSKYPYLKESERLLKSARAMEGSNSLGMFDEEWYEAVLDACCLWPDLQMFAKHDLTVIGEKGVTLSGGQRARIGLARAVYACGMSGSVCLLDDPLSALDPATSHAVFERLLGPFGLLARRGVATVLVTHATQYLAHMDKVLVLMEDYVSEAVSPSKNSPESSPTTALTVVARPVYYGQHKDLVSQYKHLVPEEEVRRLTSSAVTSRSRGGSFANITSTPLLKAQSPLLTPLRVAKAADGKDMLPLSLNPDVVPEVVPSDLRSSLQARREALFHSLIVTAMIAAASEAYDSSKDSSSGVVVNGVAVEVSESDPTIPPLATIEEIEVGLEDSANPATPATEPRSKESLLYFDAPILEPSSSDYKSKQKVVSHVRGNIGRLMTTEERSSGKMPPAVVWRWYQAGGGLPMVLTIFGFMFIERFGWAVMDFWMAAWSTKSTPGASATGIAGWIDGPDPRDSQNSNQRYWLAIYVAICAVNMVSVAIRILSYITLGARASERIFWGLIHSMLRAPMSFFETTPAGRLQLRLTGDVDTMDTLTHKMMASTTSTVQIFVSVVATAIVLPYILLLLGPIMVMYAVCTSYYRRSGRELQRLDMLSRSPVMAHLSESLSGASTIRAFDAARRFTEHMDTLIDANNRAVVAFNASVRWLSVRLDLLGSLLMLVIPIVGYYMSNTINGTFLGFAILQAITFCNSLQFNAMFLVQAEAAIVSLQRILEYSDNLPQEAPLYEGVDPAVYKRAQMMLNKDAQDELNSSKSLELESAQSQLIVKKKRSLLEKWMVGSDLSGWYVRTKPRSSELDMRKDMFGYEAVRKFKYLTLRSLNSKPPSWKRYVPCGAFLWGQVEAMVLGRRHWQRYLYDQSAIVFNSTHPNDPVPLSTSENPETFRPNPADLKRMPLLKDNKNLVPWAIAAELVQSVGKSREELEVDRRCFCVHSHINNEVKQAEFMRSRPQWPCDGSVCFDNVRLRYRQGLPLALRGLTVSISSGESIAIVGRTGAGKSTIAASLFRIIELAGGTIRVGGEDIATVGLSTLRGSGMTVIPQDPVLFSGTVRYNLDPFRNYSDCEVWFALEAVGLDRLFRKDIDVSQTPEFSGIVIEENEGTPLGDTPRSSNDDVMKSPRIGLDTLVTEDSLSLGQKQLLCLARALLKKPKILMLDEATSSTDEATDAEMMRIAKKFFNDRGVTTISIAHRLQTVINNDKVLVMDKGTAIEFDAPHTLLQNDNSMFTALVKANGPEVERLLRDSAEKSFKAKNALQ